MKSFREALDIYKYEKKLSGESPFCENNGTGESITTSDEYSTDSVESNDQEETPHFIDI